MDYKNLKLEKYQPTQMRIDQPMISISKLGFRFNVASQKYMNRHYKYCELYFDKAEMVIAIKPTNALSENSLKISRSMLNSPSVCAKDFLKRTGIKELIGLPDDFKGMRILPVWDDKAKMFLLDLKPLIK